MFFLSDSARMVHKINPNGRKVIGPIYYYPMTLASHNAVLYVRSNVAYIKTLDMHGEPAIGRLAVVKKTSVRKDSGFTTVTAKHLNSEEFS
jgi:hypothetical protein